MADEEDIYGKAFADMGSEPLELDEQVGGWGGHRPGAGRKSIGDGPRAKIAVTVDAALLAKLDRHIAANGGNRSAVINELLASAFNE